MSRDRAAYMRDYRKRKAEAHRDYDAAKPTIGRIKTECADRIAELEGEVRHLKAELAQRPPQGEIDPDRVLGGHTDEWTTDRFNTRPFTPVPKHR